MNPTDEPGWLTVHVELGPRAYDVVVTHDRSTETAAAVSTWLERSWSGRGCRRALIVTDDHVATLPPVAQVRDALGTLGIAAETAVVPHGEASKGLATASSLYDQLTAMKADRHTLVTAVGGGVIGDLAGFAAATYARGLPLLMVPTTLLAQVDSSVGGKVGVNHPRAKNIIGAFHQPIGVWIDVKSLDTLPDRELRCGAAEVVKYGVILDAPFFEELEGTAADVLARRPEALGRIIARSCELKAMVVTRDEREETGLRAVLNFGHTIGHAVEAVAGYGGGFEHGEAVAVGMVAECRLAERLGWIDADLTARLTTLLERFGLPTSISGLDPDSLLDAMGRDKKNRDGRIRFVLPRRIGEVELTDAPTPDDVRGVLRDLCRTTSASTS
jgi:3-dehydroquinate synthase